MNKKLKKLLAACLLLAVLSALLPLPVLAADGDGAPAAPTTQPADPSAPPAVPAMPPADPSAPPADPSALAAPRDAGTGNAGDPDPLPAPMVIVSREDKLAPLEAGQEREIVITFQNLGDTALLSPVAAFTVPDELSIPGGASAFPLGSIEPKKTQTLTLRLKVGESVSANPLKLEVELRFNYHNGVSLTQSSSSDKLLLPAVVTKTPAPVTNPQPAVLVTRSQLAGPLSAKETVEVTLFFKNGGQTALVGPVVSFSTSDALVLLNDTSTFSLPDIAPGATESVKLKLQAGKEISSTTQSVSADMKFTYDNGSGVMEAGTASERVNLAANIKAPSYGGGGSRTSAPVPNIIIDRYGYGGDSVSAGRSFDLEFQFTNTGKLKVENAVITIDGGDSFTMNGSTNTFYYPLLAGGASQTHSVPMTALSSAKTGAQSIGVSFKYEYVDGGTRSSTTAEIKLSVPVVQPDRFQINQPALPETCYVGEELALSLSFVNKGKADVSNVEASVTGAVDTPAATQYLGNFESGKSGNIGFAITPREAGETKLVLKVSYEDANQQVQTREFPVTLSVSEPVYEEYPAEGMGEEAVPRRPRWPWIAGAVLALGGGAAALTLRRRKKAAALAGDAAAEDWSEWTDAPYTPAEAGAPPKEKED